MQETPESDTFGAPGISDKGYSTCVRHERHHDDHSPSFCDWPRVVPGLQPSSSTTQSVPCFQPAPQLEVILPCRKDTPLIAGEPGLGSLAGWGCGRFAEPYAFSQQSPALVV